MLSLVVLFVVFSASIGSVAYAYTRKNLMRDEVRAVVRLIDEGATGNSHQTAVSLHIRELVQEALRVDHHQTAVAAVNELTGRAHLFRSQALLLSRSLPRIGLLSGGGGAFVIVAVGSFDQASLVRAVASVSLGVVAAFSSYGLSSQARQAAKRYGEITDVLARQVRLYFG